MNRRGGFRDFDEYEQDELERKQRAKLNKEFETFVRAVEFATDSRLKFDIPYRNLGFTGSPQNNHVTLMPTINCLINLSYTPFFVVSMEEVEVAFFERVGMTIKNFDLVFIRKDYSKQVVFINAIPVAYKDQIKNWLNSIDILFFEMAMNIKWDFMLKRIRKDPEHFVNEEGGWGAFAEEEEGPEEDDDLGADSEFDSADLEEPEEESISDYTEDDGADGEEGKFFGLIR